MIIGAIVGVIMGEFVVSLGAGVVIGGLAGVAANIFGWLSDRLEL